MRKNKLRYIFFFFILSLLVPTMAKADAIGSWKLYPCYNKITDIQPAGDKVYVLASGFLYSYNNHDTSLQDYNELTGLSSNNITNIAWVQSSKKLIVIYSDSYIDLLYENGDVTCISDYANKTITGDKTVNDIYVNGQYAYISTGFGIIKLDVKNEYISDTYFLGYNVNYCYISGNKIYAASSTQGMMCANLNANLLDKNNWTREGDYSEKVKEQYVYDSHNKCYWAAGDDSKLTKYMKQDDGTYTAASTGVKPDGPASNRCWRLYKNNGILYSTAGNFSYGMALEATTYPGEVNCFNNGSWSQLPMPEGYVAANCMAFDPKNSNHFFVGGAYGLIEYSSNNIKATYGPQNSSLIEQGNHNYGVRNCILTSMTYDSSNNLWIMNGWADPSIHRYSSSGEWKSFPHQELSYKGRTSIDLQGVYVSSTNGYMWWANHYYNKSILYRYDYKNDKLTAFDEFINEDGTQLNFTDMFDIAEDKSGNIWVATSAGPLYVSKADATSGGDKFTFIQHKVPRNDGTNYADYLLSGISTRCVKIDAANRKWIGTEGDGVYLISKDNNTQIYHFTTNDSPLLSNTIFDILIDDETGIVYFATEGGLCSFQADITSTNGDDSGMSTDNVYAYPNPVTPEFTGMVTIVGLSTGAQLKITTASGQLVHEATCSGGSYKWNMRDMNGDKVVSGVYMVLIANSTGEDGCVSKIAIIR